MGASAAGRIAGPGGRALTKVGPRPERMRRSSAPAAASRSSAAGGPRDRPQGERGVAGGKGRLRRSARGKCQYLRSEPSAASQRGKRLTGDDARAGRAQGAASRACSSSRLPRLPREAAGPLKVKLPWPT